MKDEIKEILLKDFNEILVKEFCTDWKEKRLYIELLVNSTPFSNLLNYITNLQEEVKSANESITWWNNRFNAVQEENKKLKNKLEDEKKNYQRITTYLQEENERLKDIRNLAIDYNKTLCKLYDCGTELSNAETNLCILEDEETINTLQGKSDE